VVRSVTNIEPSVASGLRKTLEETKLEKGAVLRTVISEERAILRDQSVNYYDLLLLMVEDNPL
jgi:hypothetical protein